MAPQLWLLRHGEAVPHESKPDADRELTPRGERQALAAGAGLAQLGIEFDACYTSPKVRARDTARIACAELGVDVTEEPALQGGPFDPRDIAGDLDEVLLVGHDPDFSAAVHSLTGAQVRMKKGGLAGIDRGELIVLMRPRELRLISS